MNQTIIKITETTARRLLNKWKPTISLTKEDMEDIIAECVIKVLQMHNKVEIKVIDGKLDSSTYKRLVGRLRVTIHRGVKRILKYREHIAKAPPNILEGIESNGEYSVFKFSLKDCYRWIAKVETTDVDRDAAILHYLVQGKTIKEICTKLNINRATVYRLKRKLREVLKV